MHASIRELRLHTKEFLDVANRGEEVIVTYRGKDYVKLTPITHVIDQEDSAFGLWQDNPKVANVDKFINQLRAPRHHDID